jgi:hypothetical protein
MVAKVKRDAPGSSVLVCFDMNNLPLMRSSECAFCRGDHLHGDRPGRNCSTSYQCGPSPYLSALQEGFPQRLAVHDVTNGAPGVMFEGYPGLAKYEFTEEAARRLSNFLSGWIMRHDFDGIYLDGYVEPTIKARNFVRVSRAHGHNFLEMDRLYDIDGDGHPEDTAQIAASHFAWAPSFVASLRAQLGPKRTILANSGGPISDSSLSGIAIESEFLHRVRSTHSLGEAFVAQHAVTLAGGENREPLSVFWLTHSNAVPKKRQCDVIGALQEKYPWLQAGTDFFDGSYVVCPRYRRQAPGARSGEHVE